MGVYSRTMGMGYGACRRKRYDDDDDDVILIKRESCR